MSSDTSAGAVPQWTTHRNPQQQVEIDEAFSIRRENELPRVAALCHMVRGVESDDAYESSQEQKVPQSHQTGKVPSVPSFSGFWP